MTHKSPEQIIQAVYEAGVVGAGGGGFPAHVKLGAKVEMIIANGSECEPLLYTDKVFMKEKASLVMDGLEVNMAATGATEAVLAVKGYYKDVVGTLNAAIPPKSAIRVHSLENYYPAGDEFLTVYDVTGRVIPEGGLPLHVGVVVNNVFTLAQIAEAIHGKAVTDRILTIAGEVAKPQVITVPVGMSYAQIIELAGGVTCEDPVVIDGGPMMGAIVEDLSQGILKTTSGILVLPREHFVPQMKLKSVGEMVKLSKAACCQCYRCTDLCPRHLLGHAIHPHMTMRTIDYNMPETPEHITSAFLCSQCGVCEMIACDFMRLSPKKIYAEYRKQLVARGVRNPHNKKLDSVREAYEYRKVGIPTVLKKMNLTQYAKPLPYEGTKATDLVRINYRRHIGAPASPEVKLGQKLVIGERIASSPREKMGVTYHASIVGKVTEITDSVIEIRGTS